MHMCNMHHVRNVTHSYVQHDLSYVRHDLLMCMTSLIHIKIWLCDATRPTDECLALHMNASVTQRWMHYLTQIYKCIPSHKWIHHIKHIWKCLTWYKYECITNTNICMCQITQIIASHHSMNASHCTNKLNEYIAWMRHITQIYMNASRHTNQCIASHKYTQ